MRDWALLETLAGVWKMGSNEEYLSVFIDESREHLQAMNDGMLKLEQTPDDVRIVQEIFRSAHTMKGMSATMGFEDLAKLTHEMENVLDLIRNRKLDLSPSVFDVLFASLDALDGMLQDIIRGGSGEADVTALVERLQAVARGETTPSSAERPSETVSEAEEPPLDQYQLTVLRQALDTGHRVFHVAVTLDEGCVLKAARAYMIFQVLENNGEIVRSFPSAEDIEREAFDRTISFYCINRLPPNELERLLLNISEVRVVRIAEIDRNRLAELARDAQQGVQLPSVSPSSSTSIAAAKEDTARIQQAAAAPGPERATVGSSSSAAVGRTIRVDSEKLDILMNLLSELLIDRVRLESIASAVRRQELTETIEHLSRISSDLQAIVFKLRMMPVETVFNRFPRMVRDLARSLNKKIELVVTGADTELDRTVVDEIGDPLVHLLRNAVDHGIESPDERLAAGKPETGTLALRAYTSGNHVFIEIEDDGRGIRRDKVVETALRNGIITREQAERLSDEEVYQLLFAPGFSTAEKITDISGRGVGLDVVKSKIEALGGKVVVESTLGKGTKFSVQLPLTLSIISAMLVKVGEETYAVPISSLVETMIVSPGQVRNLHGEAIMNYRSGVIPVVSLGRLFDVPGAKDADRDETYAVVIRKGRHQLALLADELLGQQDIVLKPLGKYLTPAFAVSGATILGDGRVALIVDPNALMN